MAIAYEVRKCTGSYTNHGPEIGSLVSRHRLLCSALAKCLGPDRLIIWAKENGDLRPLNASEHASLDDLKWEKR